MLGVADLTRQGAVRHTAADDAVFLAPDPRVPRLIALPGADTGDAMEAVASVVDR